MRFQAGQPMFACFGVVLSAAFHVAHFKAHCFGRLERMGNRLQLSVGKDVLEREGTPTRHWNGRAERDVVVKIRSARLEQLPCGLEELGNLIGAEMLKQTDTGELVEWLALGQFAVIANFDTAAIL